jgi:serine protease Do
MDNQASGRGKTNKRLFGLLMVLVVLGLGIGIGTLISNRVDATGPADSQLQMQTDGKPVVGGAVLALSQAFEEVASRIEPAVVNINTEEVIDTRRSGGPGQSPDDPMNDWYRRFFGGPFPQMPEQQMRRSLGSGVIVDPKGYIITNNHVVEGATRIKVSGHSGEEYTAKVIGTDPVSDIAVIKITGKKDFPFAKIGNSKGMRVGDWVIAVGSPFNLDQTVTAGIVSATGRTFKQEDSPFLYSQFNDYLQTDAAINPGNSGGPLVNMNAEVVGINSFISTSSGSSAGVGFAVPSHLFTKVYNQILQTGKVARGYLGVYYNGLPFTPAMANYFGVKQGAGVLVTRVGDEKGPAADAGPAAKAGIKAEDVIVEYDGKKIQGVPDFLIAVADTLPGRKVKVKAIRFGQEKEFEVTVAERQFEGQEKGRYSFEDKEEKPKAELGLEIDDVPRRVSQSMEINGGAYVTSVSPGSLADDAGLAGTESGGSGDVIVAVNGKPVANAQELVGFVKSLKSGDAFVVKFQRIIGRDQESNKVATGTYYTSIIKP